jgi:hypothetical protein
MSLPVEKIEGQRKQEQQEDVILPVKKGRSQRKITAKREKPDRFETESCDSRQ